MHAVAQGSELAPAFDQLGAVDACGLHGHRCDRRAPAQQRRGGTEHAGQQRAGHGPQRLAAALRIGRWRPRHFARWRGRGRRRCGQGVDRCTHDLGRERRLAKAHAGGVEDRVGNRRSARHRRRFAHAQRRLARPRHQHHLDHRHLAEAEDRVAAPLAAGHRTGLAVDAGLLLQRAAGGLQHVAVHLVHHAGRVDHHPGVVADDDPAHVHLAGLLVHVDIGHPRGPGRTEAGELAVHVAGIGEALALEPVAVGGLLLRLRVGQPPGLVSGGTHQLGGAIVGEVLQPVRHRVDTGRRGQLVDVALVRKGVRQRRHAAQPRGAQDRRHVVDGDALVRVAVGRHGGAVAHLEGLRHRLDGARQQQRQRRCGVAGVRGREVVGRG